MNDSTNDEITKMIISKLGKHQSRNEIIVAICEKSGQNWTEAEKLIEQVEAEHQRTIATHQSPVLIIISSMTIIAGIGLLGYGILFFVDFFQVETVERVLLLRTGYLRIISILTGLAMLGGCLYSLWGTFSSLGW